MSAKRKPPTTRDIAKSVAQSAYDLKADDIKVLDLRKVSSFTDFFIIASGRSDRQVQAIADRIEQNLKGKAPLLGKEGYQKGHWVLLDFGSVVAHIFYEEIRNFYTLERLWSDAPVVKLKFK